jgi:hypothetical protein
VLLAPSDLQNEMLMKYHHEGRLEVGFLVSLLVISFVLKQLIIDKKGVFDTEMESLFTNFLFSV